MSDPRDGGSSEPGSGGAQSGTPAAGQPRKPRIEVLQRAPAAAPAPPGSAQGPDSDGVGRTGAAAAGAPRARAAWAPDRAGPAEAPPARRRGLLRSPTMLLSLLACIVIAGFLLYTYVSSERGAEHPDKGIQLSPEDADLVGEPGADFDDGATRVPAEPAADSDLGDGAGPEPEPAEPPEPRPAPPSAAEPEDEPAAEDRPQAPPPPEPEAADGNEGASDTVRAFYSALGAGDGASAARLVVPAKRRGGPLSAAALSRYYSSFRRPLRLRSLSAVDSNTVRVAYDYVLSDGRVCRGQAAVDVVQSGGRSLVSGIRTSGPC